MAEALKKTDIADDDFLNNIIPTDAQLNMLREMDSILSGIAQKNKEKATGGGASANNFQAVVDEAKAQERLTQAYQIQIEISKQKQQVEQKNIELNNAGAEASKKVLGTIEQNAALVAKYKEELKKLKIQEKLGKISQKQFIVRQAELKQAMSEANITIKQQVKEQQAGEGSAKKFAIQVGQLRDAYNNLSDVDRESAFGKEMLANIQRMDGQIKNFDASIGNNHRNVGNYASALDGAAMSLNAMGINVGGFVSKASGVTPVVMNVVKSMKTLKVALISTGIGALVVAVGMLIAYFSNVTEAGDKLSIVMKQIGAVIDVVVSRIATLGGAIFKFFTGDFSGAVNDVKKAFTGITDELSQQLDLAKQIAKIQNNLNITEGVHAIIVAANTSEFENQRTLANDLALSAEERLKHANAALTAQRNIVNEEKNRIKLQKEQAMLEYNATPNDKGRIEAQKKYAEALAAEGDSQRKLRQAMKLVDGIQEEINKNTQDEIKSRNEAAEAARKQAIDTIKGRMDILKAEQDMDITVRSEEMLRNGMKRAEVEEEVAAIVRGQLEDQLDLYQQMNAEELTRGKFNEEIAELKLKIADSDQKSREVVTASLEKEKKRTNELLKQYEALKLQDQLFDIDAEISQLDKESIGYYDKLKELYQKRYNLNKDALINERDAELSSLKEGSQEYINAKLKHDFELKKLDKKFADEIMQANKAAADATAEDLEKSLADRQKMIETTEQQITDGINKQIDTRIKKMDEESSARANQISYLRDLAKTGNITAQQSLKEEIEAQRQLDKEKEKLERRKANLQMISAGILNFQNALQSGKTGAQALSETVLNMKILEQILAGMNFFYRGTQNAPEGLAVVDERGAEIHTDKHGVIKSYGSPEGANLRYLNKGDKIYTADQSRRLLDGMMPSLSSGLSERYTDGYGLATIRQLQALNDKMDKKESIFSQFDSLTSTVIQMQKKKNVRLIKKIRV